MTLLKKAASTTENAQCSPAALDCAVTAENIENDITKSHIKGEKQSKS
jgi:hypothetical protein